MVDRHVQIAAVAVFNEDGDFIMQRRSNHKRIRPGELSFWGGHIGDKPEFSNETPLEAAIRELREESNINPDKKSIIFVARFVLEREVTGDEAMETFLYSLTVSGDEPVIANEGASVEQYNARQLVQRTDTTTSVVYALGHNLFGINNQ